MTIINYVNILMLLFIIKSFDLDLVTYALENILIFITALT